jgi:hypothetical protein
MMMIFGTFFLSERSVIFLFLMESAVFVNSFVNPAPLFKIEKLLLYFKYLIYTITSGPKNLTIPK